MMWPANGESSPPDARIGIKTNLAWATVLPQALLEAEYPKIASISLYLGT